MKWLTLLFSAVAALYLTPMAQAQTEEKSETRVKIDIDMSFEEPDARFRFWPGRSNAGSHTITVETVSPGHKIYEFTMSRTRNDDNNVKRTTDTVGEMAIRTAVNEKMEVVLGFAGFINEDTETAGNPKANDSGHGDLRLGGKIRLSEETDTLPGTAFYAEFSLPTGSHSVSSRRIDPSFGLTLEKSLHDEHPLRAIGSVGMSWESDRYSAPTDNDIDTLSTVDWSAGVGYAGLVAEFYGNAGMSRQGGPENSFRVTANNVYANIAGNLQTSIYGAWGLSDDADDWEAGIAFSFWRQPWTKEHVEAEIEMDTDGG